MDLRDPTLPAQAVIYALGLQPHPEGGHYREIFRDAPADGSRGAMTSIHFLLAAGERSSWHRVDADELWLWQAGAPLVLTITADEGERTTHWLGPEIGQGGSLQHLVPRRCWQAAWSKGDWTLVSCVVAPAFQFAGFELATAGQAERLGAG